jgi:hypothetical protein
MSALDIARKALAELSQHIDCGCVPCFGQCWGKDELREEIANRADEARKALAAINAAETSGVRCDEPEDVFNRITRDMARSA